MRVDTYMRHATHKFESITDTELRSAKSRYIDNVPEIDLIDYSIIKIKLDICLNAFPNSKVLLYVKDDYENNALYARVINRFYSKYLRQR